MTHNHHPEGGGRGVQVSGVDDLFIALSDEVALNIQGFEVGWTIEFRVGNDGLVFDCADGLSEAATSLKGLH
ncbi:hypothetical protein Rwratislav_00665 [Rhodococcus wratislaviensis IFP 2016]|nr:hypothetical protein Rwratislav_00665 [Rhodococcus wratislaviensis IFP 2016]